MPNVNIRCVKQFMLPSIRDHALALLFDNLTCREPAVSMIGPLHKTRVGDAELGKAPDAIFGNLKAWKKP